MLKQVEIDASKIQRVKTSLNIESKNTESKILIEAINRNVNEKIQSEKSDEEYREKLNELRLGF